MFDDKSAADANTGNATNLRESLAEFLMDHGSPLIREGEIIWSFDADRMADSTVNTLKSVPVSRRIRVGRISKKPKLCLSLGTAKSWQMLRPILSLPPLPASPSSNTVNQRS